MLVMAAGQGTRMRSSMPKMLPPVCGRPMVAWPILAARDAGAGRVAAIVSPGRDVSAGLPEGVETVEQPEADGTGGAIRAARIAPPVPSGSGCSTVSTPSGSPAEMSRSGETIAATRPVTLPASRAARTGQATIGRPQTGCSIFGVAERMRVPEPAAMTRTRGAATALQIIREGAIASG